MLPGTVSHLGFSSFQDLLSVLLSTGVCRSMPLLQVARTRARRECASARGGLEGEKCVVFLSSVLSV